MTRALVNRKINFGDYCKKTTLSGAVFFEPYLFFEKTAKWYNYITKAG